MLTTNWLILSLIVTANILNWKKMLSFVSITQTHKQHAMSSLWFQIYKVVHNRFYSPATGIWEEAHVYQSHAHHSRCLPGRWTVKNQKCSKRHNTSAAFLSFHGPSSVICIKEICFDIFCFVISNWSNPTNKFLENQSTVHVRKREAERKSGRTPKKKSPALNGKLFFLTEKHLLPNFFHHHYFSNSPGVISLWVKRKKKVHFLFPTKYRAQCIISLQIYTFKHVGCHWWRSSLGIITLEQWI